MQGSSLWTSIVLCCNIMTSSLATSSSYLPSCDGATCSGFEFLPPFLFSISFLILSLHFTLICGSSFRRYSCPISEYSLKRPKVCIDKYKMALHESMRRAIKCTVCNLGHNFGMATVVAQRPLLVNFLILRQAPHCPVPIGHASVFVEWWTSEIQSHKSLPRIVFGKNPNIVGTYTNKLNVIFIFIRCGLRCLRPSWRGRVYYLQK